MIIIVTNTNYIIDARNSLDLPLTQGKTIVKVYLDKVCNYEKYYDEIIQKLRVLKTYNSKEEAFVKLQNMREAFLNGQNEFILE